MLISKEGREQEMFAKNFELLSPWLQSVIRNVSEKEMQSRIEVIRQPDGLPLCRYRKNGRIFQINSKYPVKEAEQWAASLPVQQANAIFLYGCGFGYPLFQIFKEKQPHVFVMLFEQNLYLFRAMLYYFDLEPILRSGKIALFVGGSDCFGSALDQLLYSVQSLSCTVPTVLWTHAAQRNFKKEYLELHRYVFQQMSLMSFQIGNDHSDNLTGLKNILANTETILRAPYLSCLKDTYRGYPAFIIANGPSLDGNIHELEKIGGKGLIISVESAIKPLMKNHITPDILTVVERTPATYTSHFQNMHYPKEIALICLALVDGRVFPSFAGEKIPVFRHQEAINEWVNQFLGDEIGLDAGSNVSHLAVEIAAFLGADPIVLVGQDYAFGPEGLSHSKDSVYYEEVGKEAEKLIQSRPVVSVEGNNGKMIPSYQLWVDFRLGMERKIAAHPEKTFLNATEGGAKIQGTTCDTLENVITRYCTKPLSRRVNEWIAESREAVNPEERKQCLDQFIGSIQDYARSFHELSRTAVAGRLNCRRMLCLCEKEEYEANRDLLNQAYQDNNAMLQKFNSKYLHRCFCQQVLFSNYYYLNHLGVIDSNEKIHQVFQAQYNFFFQLNVVCQSVSVHLEDAEKALMDLQKKQNTSGGRML